MTANDRMWNRAEGRTLRAQTHLSHNPSHIHCCTNGPMIVLHSWTWQSLGTHECRPPDQSLDRQKDELKAAGAEMIYAEVGSGKKGADRPQWEELLRSLRKGDTLMVTELSRLGRSTSQLSALADDLSERKVSLKILNLGIDTGTPAGQARLLDHRRRGRDGT